MVCVRLCLKISSSSFSGNLKLLVEYLNKAVDVLSKNSGQLDNVLQQLEFEQHSLGILAILMVKYDSLSSAPDTFDQLFNLTKDFVSRCDSEQVRYASLSCELPCIFQNCYYLLYNSLTNTQRKDMWIETLSFFPPFYDILQQLPKFVIISPKLLFRGESRWGAYLW